MDVKSIIGGYNLNALTIATLGSHSALDICSGAKKQGFHTLVVAQKGRERMYSDYYKTEGKLGCVDEVMALESFKDVLREDIQEELRKKNTIFVPHRSFQVYLDFDYEAIENDFMVPIFGNRYLLRVEERNARPNQYDLLQEANIRIPKIYEDAKRIDRPVIVKVLEKERGFERAFFVVSRPEEFEEKSRALIQKGRVTETGLKNAVIEEFMLGVQVNLHYFYSPRLRRLEFMGSDTRRQTNIEGFLRLPSFVQKEAGSFVELKFEEAGHIAATLLESMLEDVFRIGERFVAATQKLFPPGIIGPFALQAFILPGPPKKEFVVFDVSPRMPGSPGIRFTPYGEYLWGRPISMGERVGIELKGAADLELLLT